MNIDADLYVEAVHGLDDWDEGDGPAPEWSNHRQFADWLDKRGLPQNLRELLLKHTPLRLKEGEFGVWYGVEDLIDGNESPYYDLRSAQLLAVGSGLNGDIICVDYGSGEGACGWLPMAMLGGKAPNEIRDLFIATAKSIGNFLHQVETSRSECALDWYEAKMNVERRSGTNDG